MTFDISSLVRVWVTMPLCTYHQTAETEDAVVRSQTQTHAANSSDNSEDSEHLFTVYSKYDEQHALQLSNKSAQI